MTEQEKIKIKLYSPLQVALASFGGGPFAVVYVLKKNFDALGKKVASRQTLIYGAIFNVFMLGAPLLPIPAKLPNYIIPIVYSVAARLFAEKHQMTKRAIRDSADYSFQSAWKVLGVSVGCLIATMLLYMFLVF